MADPGSAAELAAALAARCPAAGVHATRHPRLRLVRADAPTIPTPVVYDACVCVVVQGAKEARSNDAVYTYDASQYLVLSMALPLSCRITEASLDRPYLALLLDLDAVILGDLLAAMAVCREVAPGVATEEPPRAIRVSPTDPDLHDSLMRMLRVLGDPLDQKVLAEGVEREILYRLLRGPQAAHLRAAAYRDDRSWRIAKVVRFVHQELAASIDVAALAEMASMSTSAFGRDFKAATGDPPLRYLKKVRLYQARALMQHEGIGAAEAAYRVGYASPSQFSREFRRQFGVSPSEDARQPDRAQGRDAVPPDP
ncbi:MAG: AraC family transcriptional regulator [Planctomycetota bacterium]